MHIADWRIPVVFFAFMPHKCLTNNVHWLLYYLLLSFSHHLCLVISLIQVETMNSLVRQGGTWVIKCLKEKFPTNSSVLKSYAQLTWCATVINMISTASILHIFVVVLYSIVVYGPKEAVGLDVIYTLDHDVHPR